VSLFVWALPFDLSGMGGPTSSYATSGIALRVTESHSPPPPPPLQGGAPFGGAKNFTNINSWTFLKKFELNVHHGAAVLSQQLAVHLQSNRLL